MKLYFVDSDSLSAIKSNLHTIVSRFASDDGEWLKEILGIDPFRPTKFPDIPDFVLDTTADKPFLTEAKNAEIVYSHLSFLSDSQASDERFWAALCLREFWKYTQYRWDIKKNCTEDTVKQTT